MKRTVKMMIAGLTVAGFSALRASAIMIDVTPTSLPGTTLADRPELAGVVLEDVTMPFHIWMTGHTGTLQSRVVRENGTGTLDFYWRVKLDAVSDGEYYLKSLTIGEFYPFGLYDADWRSDDLGTVSPDTARLLWGGTTQFTFGGGLPAGVESRFMFMHTDATKYHSGDTRLGVGPYMWATEGRYHEVAWSYGSSTVGIFGPVPVPDGGCTATLLGSALIMLRGLRRVIPAGRA